MKRSSPAAPASSARTSWMRSLERGDEVTVIDDLSTGRRENLERALAARRRAGRGSTSATPRAVARRSSSAAQPEVDLPPRRPDRRAQVGGRPGASTPAINVGGTVNLLRGRARRTGWPRFVNTSTGGAIYGEGQILPAPEDHPVGARGAVRPVEVLRRAATASCSRACTGCRTVSLRYGNVYGPRQDPLGEAGVVAIFCGALLEGRHADDLRRRRADARLRLRGRRRGAPTCAPPSRRPRGAVQHRHGRADDRARARRGARPSLRQRFSCRPTPDRPGEVQHIALDTSRAREELGWEARVDLDEGLELTLASLR